MYFSSGIPIDFHSLPRQLMLITLFLLLHELISCTLFFTLCMADFCFWAFYSFIFVEWRAEWFKKLTESFFDRKCRRYVVLIYIINNSFFLKVALFTVWRCRIWTVLVVSWVSIYNPINELVYWPIKTVWIRDIFVSCIPLYLIYLSVCV